MQRLLIAACLLAAGFAAAARADSLVASNITYPDIVITSIQNGEMYYTFAASQVRRPLAQISRITLKDEPVFTAAETAFVAHDWDKAIDGYEKTLKITSKAWLKEWVSLRLLDAASQTGRFDSAVRGYIALAEKTPASAQALKLKMPRPESAYLLDAIRQVESAIAQSKQDATKEVLLGLLVELHKARGDQKSADAILQRQADIRAARDASNSAQRQAVRSKLKSIGTALAQKQYDQVISLAQKELPGLIDPADQAEALFAMAEAKAGKALANPDPDVWKDVALAYMRVVVAAPPPAPIAASALLKTAAIHEYHLSDKAGALKIYQQIAAEFPGQDAARAADAEIRRLK